MRKHISFLLKLGICTVLIVFFASRATQQDETLLNNLPTYRAVGGHSKSPRLMEKHEQQPNVPNVSNNGTSTAACKKNNHFVMIKTEKTGSSTLFSIMSRFIFRHQLNVMVMTKGGHIDVRKPRGSKPGWDIGPEPKLKADALVHHARYNESILKKFMHADTKYITLVREATSWFESAVKFWPGQVQFKSADEVVTTPHLFYANRSILKDDYNGQRTIFHLSQLQWLGLNYDYHTDIEAITKYIDYIVPKFDIVFLTDRFDASLIRMKREFCWEHIDILYKPKEVGGRLLEFPLLAARNLSSQGKSQLLTKRYNLGEQLLYEKFNRSWWSKPGADKDFWDEVSAFTKTNDMVNRICPTLTLHKSYTLKGNKWSSDILLTQSLCSLIFYENYHLIHKLAYYAIGAKYDPAVT